MQFAKFTSYLKFNYDLPDQGMRGKYGMKHEDFFKSQVNEFWWIKNSGTQAWRMLYLGIAAGRLSVLEQLSVRI